MSSSQTKPTPAGPPTSSEEQLNRLLQRGMLIQDQDSAIWFLSNVNYYRFRGYLEPFIEKPTSNSLRPFLAGTTFDAAVERYIFDMHLRTLLMEAFSHIEVSMRTQWTYGLAYSQGGGKHAHLNPNLFGSHYGENLATLKKEYREHGKKLHHYDFQACPIWVISEIMSFGQLSRWYNDTDLDITKSIARHYQLNYRVVRSLLRPLTLVRNFCAHHELLWDRAIASPFKLPTQMGAFPAPRTFFNETETGKLYNTLVIIAYLTQAITAKTDWSRSLLALLNQFPNIPKDRMGFISDWQGLAIWQG